MNEENKFTKPNMCTGTKPSKNSGSESCVGRKLPEALYKLKELERIKKMRDSASAGEFIRFMLLLGVLIVLIVLIVLMWSVFH